MYLKFKYLFLTLIILVTLYLTILISSIIGIIIAIDENDPNKLNYYIHNQLLNQNLNLFFSKNLQENFENKIFTIDIGNGTFSGELSNETIDIFITKVSNILSKDLSSSEALLYFYYHSKDLNQYFKKVFLNSEKYSFQEFLNEADKQKINLSQNVTNEKEILADDASKEMWIGIFISKMKKITDSINNLARKVKRSDYIFLSSPTTFKLKVQHKSKNYLILLKLNGFKWSIIKFELELSDYIY